MTKKLDYIIAFLMLLLVLNIYMFFVNNNWFATAEVSKTVTMPQANISLSDNMIQQLNNNFNNHTEYAACVDVSKQTITGDAYLNDIYTFNKLESVTIGHEHYVTMPNCQNYKATIHSHPRVRCEDVLTLGDVDAARAFYSQGGLFYIIQCQKDYLEIFSRNDLYEGVVVKFQ